MHEFAVLRLSYDFWARSTEQGVSGCGRPAGGGAASGRLGGQGGGGGRLGARRVMRAEGVGSQQSRGRWLGARLAGRAAGIGGRDSGGGERPGMQYARRGSATAVRGCENVVAKTIGRDHEGNRISSSKCGAFQNYDFPDIVEFLKRFSDMVVKGLHN